MRKVLAIGAGVTGFVALWFGVLGNPRVKAWLYRGGRPNGVARALGGLWALVGRTGVVPNLLVTLEVVGPSGRVRRLPLVPARYAGAVYAVSMLGAGAAWVRDVRAAGGEAVILLGRRQEVRLVEVPAAERAPILRAYLAIAAGARDHIPVSPGAPLAAFEVVAADFPVFRIEPR